MWAWDHAKELGIIQPPTRRSIKMKKLLVFALGLGIALGTVSFSFAQDSGSDTTKKMKKKKKADKTENDKK